MVRATLVATLLALVLASPALAEVEEVEHFDTLRAMTAASDAVVLGRIEPVAPSAIAEGCGTTSTTLRIESVLAGAVPFGALTLTVDYFDCGPALALSDRIPSERGVFFLRNKATDRLRFGGGDVPAEVIEAQRGLWRLIIIAGAVVERGGRVHVPDTLNADWLGRWEGRPFEDFLQAVAPGRALATTAAARPDEPVARALAPAFVALGVVAVGLAFGSIVAVVRRRTTSADRLRP